MRIPGLEVKLDEREVPWRTTRHAGVAWFPLFVADAGTGGGAAREGAVLIRMDPGCGYPAHRHLGIEEVLVLRGGYRDMDGDHHAGDYLRYAAGSAHSPVALGDPSAPVGPSNPACLLFASARGGVENLDPQGGLAAIDARAQNGAMRSPSKTGQDAVVTPIAALGRALEAEFERDRRGARVAALLAEYAQDQTDWRRFAHFAPDAYTRNLVARSPWFELLVLCWAPGQESPIHNHAGQNCWMAVLDGRIEELQFLPPSGEAHTALRPGAARVFEPGRVAFINDDIALHLVRPADGRAGTSLHLYSRPIQTCNVYDPATGRVVARTLSYHSVGGIVGSTTGSAGDAVRAT